MHYSIEYFANCDVHVLGLEFRVRGLLCLGWKNSVDFTAGTDCGLGTGIMLGLFWFVLGFDTLEVLDDFDSMASCP